MSDQELRNRSYLSAEEMLFTYNLHDLVEVT